MEITNRLLYDGKRIDDDDTPGSLDMEEDGTVLFFFHICPRVVLTGSISKTLWQTSSAPRFIKLGTLCSSPLFSFSSSSYFLMCGPDVLQRWL